MKITMKQMIRFFLLGILLLSLTGCSYFVLQQEHGEESEQSPALEEPMVPEEPELSAEEQLAISQRERAVLEEQRKEEMGEFYVPLPAIGDERDTVTVEAKALYVTSNVAGFSFAEEDIQWYADYVRYISGQSTVSVDESRLSEINKLERILGLCEATEVNALVIDVKNDDGLVSWQSDIPIVEEVGSHWSNVMPDYQILMHYLKEHEIYTIARVVAFKDPFFAKQRPQHAIQLLAGGPYKDNKGIMWVNPFDAYVWDYNVAISKEAALRGFDEIQYDYVRFPDNAKTYNPITEFPGRDERDKDEAIEDFLVYARAELEPYHVHISADVFGVATRSWDDHPEDIGQTWRKIANQVDYICPMIYPSHYGPNWYGFAVPDQHPYGVLRASIREALERNAAQENPGLIRPWVQGFNAPWVPGYINYDAKAISDQMVASAELGVREYIIWNPSNTYNPMSFFYHDRIDESLWKEGEDVLGRTPQEVLERFFKAEHNDWVSQVYLLTLRADREANYDDFAQIREEQGFQLNHYEILSIEESASPGRYTARVNAEYQSIDGIAQLLDATFDIIMEDHVYKVQVPVLTFVAEEEASEELMDTAE